MSKDEDIKPFPSFEDLEPIDRDEFAFAFQLASNAASRAMPVEDPGQRKVGISSENDDEIEELSFTDREENRAMFALKDHLGEDRMAFFNYATRIFALMDILHSDKMESWKKADPSNPKSVLLHNAVIYAGAEARLNSDGDFDETEFFNTVERIATECGDEDF